MSEYKEVMIMIVISAVFSIAMLGASYIGVERQGYVEKSTAYECGFHPFKDARDKFEVKFYIVGILFIIFDLEITYMFPWSLVRDEIGILGYCSMVVFLLILLKGFVYEWKKGGLDW